jgi:hypothetical protein
MPEFLTTILASVAVALLEAAVMYVAKAAWSSLRA